MASNVLSPMGLAYSQNKLGAAPTYQANLFTIQSGYGSNISIGDLVNLSSGGYVTLSAHSDTTGLGVFMGVLPYYDKTFQQTAHGLNGSYQSTANPSGNIPCGVIVDPFAVFRAQVSGGPFNQNWIGQNITWLTGTNGQPNNAGTSTLALDGSSVNTTSSLPFRIEGLAGVAGGPQDPGNTNPWLLVSINPGWSLGLIGTGV